MSSYFNAQCMYIILDSLSVQGHVHIVSVLTPNTSFQFVLLSYGDKIVSYLNLNVDFLNKVPANLRVF